MSLAVDPCFVTRATAASVWQRPTCEHEDLLVLEAQLVGQQVLHALRVVDAPCTRSAAPSEGAPPPQPRTEQGSRRTVMDLSATGAT